MSYARVAAGLKTTLQRVPELRAVLDYEPTSVQDAPMVYSLLEDFGREQAGTVISTEWRTRHRLLVRWQDSAQAEAEIVALMDAILAAFAADPRLGGACNVATVESGELSFMTVSGTEYRCCEFVTRALEMEQAG